MSVFECLKLFKILDLRLEIAYWRREVSSLHHDVVVRYLRVSIGDYLVDVDEAAGSHLEVGTVSKLW